MDLPNFQRVKEFLCPVKLRGNVPGNDCTKKHCPTLAFAWLFPEPLISCFNYKSTKILANYLQSASVASSYASFAIPRNWVGTPGNKCIKIQ
jgi:hypothetical protein